MIVVAHRETITSKRHGREFQGVVVQRENLQILSQNSRIALFHFGMQPHCRGTCKGSGPYQVEDGVGQAAEQEVAQ